MSLFLLLFQYHGSVHLLLCGGHIDIDLFGGSVSSASGGQGAW